MRPQLFQQKILAWFDQFGRKNLPWQQKKTPYRVWLSEIMLQQTQVATVIPYFERFIERFPDVFALAKASEETVLHLWTGLGYYNRARNLHKTAQIVAVTYQGQFPKTSHELEALPGIGRSTAGAILALAFHQSAPILDGNVKRVLSRFKGLQSLEALWESATHYTPTQRVADYTQAMMDIGATLCTRSNPRCLECPLQKNCVAFLSNNIQGLTLKNTRKPLPLKKTTWLILEKNKKILLEKNSPKGVWASLWGFPIFSGKISLSEVEEFCLKHFNCEIHQIKKGEIFRHTFTHFHLDILPIFMQTKKSPTSRELPDRRLWYSLKNPPTIGLPAPVKRILEGI